MGILRKRSDEAFYRPFEVMDNESAKIKGLSGVIQGGEDSPICWKNRKEHIKGETKLSRNAN
jgi:hypothetical protein